MSKEMDTKTRATIYNNDTPPDWDNIAAFLIAMVFLCIIIGGIKLK